MPADSPSTARGTKRYRFSQKGKRLHLYRGAEDGTALCGAYVDGQPDVERGSGVLCTLCMRANDYGD